MQAVKYLYKYIYKGPDKAQAAFVKESNDIDEIQDYIDARYISAIEAVWHIYHFNMNSHDPSVMRLDTHLEDQNFVIFQDDEKISDVIERQKMTKLTAWFKLNSEDPDANKHLYHDIFIKKRIQ